MKIKSIYEMKHSELNKEQYICVQHFGAEINGLFAEYPQTNRSIKYGLIGKRFVDIGSSKDKAKGGKRWYSMTLGKGYTISYRADGEKQKKRNKITGLKRIETKDNSIFYVGDDKNIGNKEVHGLVIELFENESKMNIYVLEYKGDFIQDGIIDNEIKTGNFVKSIESFRYSLTDNKKAVADESND